MLTFFEKLNLSVDIDLINNEVEQILSKTSWEPTNQIGLNYRTDANDS